VWQWKHPRRCCGDHLQPSCGTPTSLTHELPLRSLAAAGAAAFVLASSRSCGAFWLGGRHSLLSAAAVVTVSGCGQRHQCQEFCQHAQQSRTDQARAPSSGRAHAWHSSTSCPGPALAARKAPNAPDTQMRTPHGIARRRESAQMSVEVASQLMCRAAGSSACTSEPCVLCPLSKTRRQLVSMKICLVNTCSAIGNSGNQAPAMICREAPQPQLERQPSRRDGNGSGSCRGMVVTVLGTLVSIWACWSACLRGNRQDCRT
jgi:hypothetical protein